MNEVEPGNEEGDSHRITLNTFAKKLEPQLDPVNDEKPLPNC